MTESKLPENKFHRIWLCLLVTLVLGSLSLELGLELPLTVLSGMWRRFLTRVMQSETAGNIKTHTHNYIKTKHWFHKGVNFNIMLLKLVPRTDRVGTEHMATSFRFTNCLKHTFVSTAIGMWHPSSVTRVRTLVRTLKQSTRTGHNRPRANEFKTETMTTQKERRVCLSSNALCSPQATVEQVLRNTHKKGRWIPIKVCIVWLASINYSNNAMQWLFLGMGLTVRLKNRLASIRLRRRQERDSAEINSSEILPLKKLIATLIICIRKGNLKSRLWRSCVSPWPRKTFLSKMRMELLS